MLYTSVFQTYADILEQPEKRGKNKRPSIVSKPKVRNNVRCKAFIQ
jgi:hypothetical protein